MLVFLNSGILALAAATVIPILIYLFVIKRPNRVIFSSIRHIKASQKRQKSKIKLKNILLLIIRCLIILSAIFALSRPALRAPFLHKWSRHSQAAVAIILDTSYSMDYLVDTRTELEIGKEMVIQISQMLTDRDLVVLYTSDRQWNRLHSNDYFGEIPEHLLGTVVVTGQPLPMEELIADATKKLKESHILNKEIFVITDFRQQEYPSDNEIPVLLLPTSTTADRNNISVQNAALEEDFVQRIFERKISFDIVNHSAYPQNDVVFQLFLNGSTVSEKVTDLQANQRKPESFNISAEEPGWYQGYVSVRNERLTFDNRSYFSFFNPDEVKVAYISDQKTIPMPLWSILEIYVKNPADIKIINDDNLNYESFAGYNFIIIDNSRPLTPRLRFILDRLLNDRRGVLHITGEQLDDLWKAYFNDKFRLEMQSYVKDTPRRITYLNRHHPIMTVFSDDNKELIEVSSFYNARLRGSANVLLQADNIPIAIEQNRELVWLFDIHDLKNKLLIDPLFPVMAYRTFLYISHNESISYSVGDRIFLPQKRVFLPTGSEIETNEQYYVFPEQGIYNVPVSPQRTNYLPVNIDYTPSDYARISQAESPSLIFLDQNWSANILRARYGFEIWKYLFLFTLLLVALEMFIVKTEEKSGNVNS